MTMFTGLLRLRNGVFSMIHHRFDGLGIGNIDKCVCRRNQSPDGAQLHMSVAFVVELPSWASEPNICRDGRPGAIIGIDEVPDIALNEQPEEVPMVDGDPNNRYAHGPTFCNIPPQANDVPCNVEQGRKQ